jgi:uncharacterized damage-inducible protein DinB
MSTPDPRYPIGRFSPPADVTPDMRETFIDDIARLPGRLRAAVQPLGETERQTPYREGGWTVAQVVHHLADSHVNAYVRLRLALTEDSPAITAYDENQWAKLADAGASDVEPSLRILEGVHQRWSALLRSLQPADFARTFVHPKNGLTPLDRQLALYAWHGRHHLAHITTLAERMGWSV